MRAAANVFFLLSAILVAGPAARAEFIAVPYGEFAQRMQAEIDEAATARGLAPHQQRTAERVAALWVFIGPCEGNSNLVPDSASAIQWVMTAKPSRDLDSTILTMIAIMTRQNLGRRSPDQCRFALEKSQP